MEVEAVAHAIQWLASQRDAQITHAIILTDSMNLPQKVEYGMRNIISDLPSPTPHPLTSLA